MNALYFLGRFHVVALHLPLALVPAAIAFDWFTRSERRRYLEPAVMGLWAAAALSAILTVVLGYMHSLEGGFDGSSVATHRWWAIGLVIVTVAAWSLRAKRRLVYVRMQAIFAILLAVLVLTTGHSGGSITHGSNFLVEYAPQPLRTLAGLQAARPPVTDLAKADPYLDIVAPILDRHCSTCHGDEKRKGGFNATERAALLKGGEEGPAVVPGDPAASEVVRRITLPEDDEKRMPAEGRAALTDVEVRSITWWIASGAPVDVTIEQMSVDSETSALLVAAAGLDGSGGSSATASDSVQPAATTDPTLMAALDGHGFLARQVSASDTHLVVGLTAPGDPVGAEELQTLVAGEEFITELDLTRSGVTDAQLEVISRLTNLVGLKIGVNQITDAGVRQLAKLTNLRVLNLHGNAAISDASLEVLAALPELRKVYAWNTDITAAGVEALRRERPDLVFELGVDL